MEPAEAFGVQRRMRTTLIAAVGLAVAVTAVASCATSRTEPRLSSMTEPPIDYETIAIGSFHYHSNWCRKCHYSSGQSGETARGPSLIDDEWLHCDGSVEGIAAAIRSGVPEDRIKTDKYTEMMPPASMMNLSDEHIYAIAAYIWVLNQAPPLESLEPVRTQSSESPSTN
jgi:cytochrome c553